MTLQVPFEDVLATAKRYAISELYLSPSEGIAVVSGFNPKLSVLVVARTGEPEAQIREILAKSGCEVYNGAWGEDALIESAEAEIFVAAVSYQSGEPTPGVWVDAYTQEPTHVQVLEAIYREFRQTGELPDVTIEEFIRGANPNVVVTSESQLRGFIDTKNAPPCP